MLENSGRTLSSFVKNQPEAEFSHSAAVIKPLRYDRRQLRIMRPLVLCVDAARNFFSRNLCETRCRASEGSAR